MAYNNIKVKERQTVSQPSQTQELGIVSEVPMNGWNAEISYEKLNIVTYKNGTFIAKRPNQGIAPLDSTGWRDVWMPILNGLGISSVVTEYAVSDSNATEPPQTGWSTALPPINAGQYIWVRVTIVYVDGQQTVFYTVGAGGVPTKTSDLTNDGEGISPFATVKQLGEEMVRAQEAEQANAKAIEAEQARAQNAEQTNDQAIADETERAEAEEKKLNTKIEQEKQRATGVENGLNSRVINIESVIPADASASNQLGTQSFINSSINALAAFFITPTATGDKAWSSRKTLLEAKTFYSGGKTRVPTQNDYAIVIADESQTKGVNGSYPTTRYSYQGGTYPDGQWDFQYIVNNTSLTQTQVDALNSGITAQYVAQISTNKNDIAAIKTKNTEQDIAISNAQETADGKVSKAGDTMTGTLSVGSASMQPNGYVTGTWFKTTANVHLANEAKNVAVLSDGWIYSRTVDEMRGDLDVNRTYVWGDNDISAVLYDDELSDMEHNIICYVLDVDKEHYDKPQVGDFIVFPSQPKKLLTYKNQVLAGTVLKKETKSVTSGTQYSIYVYPTSTIANYDRGYVKPSGGIPATDLASAVQTNLDKADNAVLLTGDQTVDGQKTFNVETDKPFTIKNESESQTKLNGAGIELYDTSTGGMTCVYRVDKIILNNGKIIDFPFDDEGSQGPLLTMATREWVNKNKASITELNAVNTIATDAQTMAKNAIPQSQKGANDGVAELDQRGFVPYNQLDILPSDLDRDGVEGYLFENGGILHVGNLYHYLTDSQEAFADFAADENQMGFMTPVEVKQLNAAKTTADNAMPKSGGQFTGRVSWNDKSLPSKATPEYFVTIEPFASGGKMYYTTQANAKSALGVNAVETNLSSLTTRVGTVEGKIPTQASTTNQLADKAFVNSSVQTNTANFRGNWKTWAEVPTDVNSYPADYAESKTPTVNDYLVVQDASGYNSANEGTWRFKYSGVWATNGKSGWSPEYQVNETPLTAAQLAALNSGATSALVGQITTNKNDIAAIKTKNTEQDTAITKAQETADGKVNKSGDTMSGDLIVNADVYAGHQFIIPASNTASRGCGIYETKDATNLFGYLSADTNHAILNVGAPGKKLSFRGNTTRPLYSTSSNANKELALLSDVNAKYTKPSGGIPETDLASAVQASLGKADSALQSIPQATSTTLGGVKLSSSTTQSVEVNSPSATEGRTYPVQVNASGQAVVNVPWESGGTYTLPAADTSTRGGIRLASSITQTVSVGVASAASGRTYPLQVNGKGQGVVNVPWTDTKYTLPAASTSVLGGVNYRTLHDNDYLVFQIGNSGLLAQIEANTITTASGTGIRNVTFDIAYKEIPIVILTCAGNGGSTDGTWMQALKVTSVSTTGFSYSKQFSEAGYISYVVVGRY